MHLVPFNKPVVFEQHAKILEEALKSGHLSGGGAYTRRCEAILEKLSQTPHRLVTSATHALEMMAILSNIQPGDEVIVPSFTFVSTANAFVLRGAVIQFADVDPFGNLLPSEVERLANPKTKAVVTVHYAGNSCDLENLTAICKKKNLILLEDAAQAIDAIYKNQSLGTFGTLGCLSFHETKNVGSGEGGSLMVNNASLMERAEIIRDKGTNRKQFLLGMVDKYSWVDIGSSYVLSDLNAAYLLPQLERLSEVTLKRRAIWKTYLKELGSTFEKAGARILTPPAHNQTTAPEGNAHMFAVIFSQKSERDRYIQEMQKLKINCTFHYPPLHLSQMGTRFKHQLSTNSQSEKISNGLVRLPLFYNMTTEMQALVIQATKDALKA